MATKTDESYEEVDIVGEKSDGRGLGELKTFAQQLSKDYSLYFQLDTTSERKLSEDAIEDLLTHLEEFCGLLEMIRIDNTICLQQALNQVLNKSRIMEEIYQKIDRLEAFVDVVKTCVKNMEEEMNKAQHLFPNNRVKKFLTSFISNSSAKHMLSTEPTPKYTSPPIFSTEEYISINEFDESPSQSEAISSHESD